MVRTMYLLSTYVGSTRNFFIEGHGVQGLKLGRDGSQLMHESTFGLYLLLYFTGVVFRVTSLE